MRSSLSVSLFAMTFNCKLCPICAESVCLLYQCMAKDTKQHHTGSKSWTCYHQNVPNLWIDNNNQLKHYIILTCTRYQQYKFPWVCGCSKVIILRDNFMNPHELHFTTVPCGIPFPLVRVQYIWVTSHSAWMLKYMQDCSSAWSFIFSALALAHLIINYTSKIDYSNDIF